MSSYSVSGYISALMIREKSTVLVEGTSDKRVVARIIIELDESDHLDADSIVIDSADLLRGDDAPLGNRALVEHAHELASKDGVRLHALVDREYREFSYEGEIADLLKCHKSIAPSLFWTRGHSTENYFFAPECLQSFLKQQLAEQLLGSVRLAVQEAFESALHWACAASLALRSEDLLERAGGLGQPSHWSREKGGAVRLDVTTYVAAFAARNVPPEKIAVLRESIDSYYSLLTTAADKNLMRWLAHGHLGWDLLWCGMAVALEHFCHSPAAVSAIATGHRDQKARCATEVIVEQMVNGSTIPFPGLWQSLGVDISPIGVLAKAA